MNKYKVLFSNTIIFAIGNFTTKLLMFFLMPLYTSFLSTSQYGMADILNTTIELMIPIFTMCIIDSVFRYSIDEEYDRNSIFTNAIIIIMLGIIVVLLFTPIIKDFISKEYLICFLILYASTVLKEVISQFIRGINEVVTFALGGIISAIFMVISNVVFLKYLNLGVNGYLLAIIISNLACIIFINFRINMINFVKISKIDKKLLIKMIKYSVYLIPNSISWWITNVANRYVIMLFCGTSMVGMFSAANKIPSLINVVSSIFQQAWQFSSSKEYKNDNYEEFYSAVFKYYHLVITICGSIVLSLTPYIAKVILSDNFYNGWIFAPLLIVASIIGCYSYYFGTIYIAIKNNRMNMISTMIGAICTVILSFILVNKFGTMGACIATVISYLIILIIRIMDTAKYIKIKFNIFKFSITLFLLIIQAIILSSGKISLMFNMVIFLGIFLINFKDINTLISIIFSRIFRYIRRN